MNIDSSNDLNHSDNEYILTNTRSDQMEYDDEDYQTLHMILILEWNPMKLNMIIIQILQMLHMIQTLV